MRRSWADILALAPTALVGRVTVHVHSERFHSLAFVRRFSREEAIRFAGTVNSDASSADSMQMGLAVVIDTNSCPFSRSASRFRSAQSPISGIHCQPPNLQQSQPEPFRLSGDGGPRHPQTRTPPSRADGCQLSSDLNHQDKHGIEMELAIGTQTATAFCGVTR